MATMNLKVALFRFFLAAAALSGCIPVEAIVSTPTHPPLPTLAPIVQSTLSPPALSPQAVTPPVRPTPTSTSTTTPTPEWGGGQVSVMMVYFNGIRLLNQVPQSLRRHLTPTGYADFQKIQTMPVSDGSRMPWGKVIFLDKDDSPRLMFSALIRAVEPVSGIPVTKGAKPSAFVVFEIPARGGSIFYIVQHGDITIESVNYGRGVPTVGRGELRAGFIPVEWLSSTSDTPVPYWDIHWVYRLPQWDAAEFYRKRVGQAVLLEMPSDNGADNRMFSRSLVNGMLLPNVAYWDVMTMPNFVMPDSSR